MCWLDGPMSCWNEWQHHTGSISKGKIKQFIRSDKKIPNSSKGVLGIPLLLHVSPEALQTLVRPKRKEPWSAAQQHSSTPLPPALLWGL